MASMRKGCRRMKIPAYLTIWEAGDEACGENAIRAEIVDKVSGEMIADFVITNDMIMEAIGGRYSCDTIPVEVGKLHRIGRIRETREMSFYIPSCEEKDRKAVTMDIAKTLCPKGWSPDEDRFSLSDIVEIQGQTKATISVSRWRNRQPADDKLFVFDGEPEVSFR